MIRILTRLLASRQTSSFDAILNRFGNLSQYQVLYSDHSLFDDSYEMGSRGENFLLLFRGSAYPLKIYCIVCPECDSEFLSYEKYINHVFAAHEDQPSLRMKGIVRKNGRIRQVP